MCSSASAQILDLAKRFAIGMLIIFFWGCGSKKKITRSGPLEKNHPSVSVKIPIEKPEIKQSHINLGFPVPKSKLTHRDKIFRYIDRFAAIAKAEMYTYQIPASITLAQGILESGAGHGSLTLRSKNHFGIKCHNWKGKKAYHDDDRSQECFRKYDDAKDSFRDHSIFLSKRKRYAKLFLLPKSDYKGWAKGLQQAGYATDPKYPSKLIGIIERYQLYLYDKEVLGSSDKKESRSMHQNAQTPSPQIGSQEIVNHSAVAKKNSATASDLTDAISGNPETYIVKKGDTLYSISKKHQLTVSQLKAINQLENNTIKIGQQLKLRIVDATFDF